MMKGQSPQRRKSSASWMAARYLQANKPRGNQFCMLPSVHDVEVVVFW
jgi:hypothetical protein